MSPPGEPAGHSDYEGMAVAHVLGGLDEHQGRVFRAHLLECAHCRARVGELRAIASDLAGVERSARREQQQGEAEHALDTKERAELPAAPPVRSVVWPRVALVGLLAGLIGLAVYAFVLQDRVARLEQELADRATAISVLQHGADAPLDYERVGISATVRMDGRDVAVVVDELDAASYRVMLIDEGGQARAVPATVDDGRLFMLVRREPGDEQLRVRSGQGQLVVEADLAEAGADT